MRWPTLCFQHGWSTHRSITVRDVHVSRTSGILPSKLQYLILLMLDTIPFMPFGLWYRWSEAVINLLNCVIYLPCRVCKMSCLVNHRIHGMTKFCKHYFLPFSFFLTKCEPPWLCLIRAHILLIRLMVKCCGGCRGLGPGRSVFEKDRWRLGFE